ncbi:MAG: hypothetical protein ACRD0P_19555, partial [Stackebrandtia sp.]
MWKFDVRLSDAGGAWRWSHGRWRAGASTITPLAHPAVEAFLLADGRRRMFVARERLTGQSPPVSGRVSPGEYDAARSAVAVWPGEASTVETRPGRIEVTAGRWGTAPLYLQATSEVLRGSWDIT